MRRLQTTPTGYHWTYRFFLFVYPPAFRAEFGADIVQLFRDRLRAHPHGRGRFLLVALRDLLTEGVRERAHAAWHKWNHRVGSPRNHSNNHQRRQSSRRATTMETFLQDIRYGFRSLRREPAIILVAVVSLALGIGANAAIFSAVDVFMLRPLPLPNADRLHQVYTTNEERDWTTVNLSIPDFLDYRADVTSLDIAAFTSRGYSLSSDERPERLIGWSVSWNFFQTIGSGPTLGRGFTKDEEAEGRHRVAVLSDGLWRRRFGADPSAIGRMVKLDGENYTIVGVLPPKFWFLNNTADMWTPMAFTGEESRRSRVVRGLARVTAGSTAQAAAVELSQAALRLAAAYPQDDEGNGARIAELHGEIFDQGFREGSMIASVAVGFVLLIACANVANLFLTRAAGREREIALRGALGAGRVRIIRQLLIEASIVALVSGAAGLLVAQAGIKGLLSIMPSNFPRVEEIALDGRVLLYVLTVSLVTGLLFGLVPALQGSRPNLTESLKEGGRTGSGMKSGRTRKALVVSEVSLALVLLVSSSLLVQGFLRLQTTDLGFASEGVHTFQITLPEQAYADSLAIAQFHTQLATRIGGIASVTQVSAASTLPLQGANGTFYTIPGSDDTEAERQPIVNYKYVLPGFFDAIDVPVVSGRDLSRSDRIGTRRVILVNEAMAQHHWPGESAIGQLVEFSSGPREIVGVVGDILEWGAINSPPRMVFFPVLQSSVRSLAYAVRTTGNPSSVTETVRTAVAAIDPDLPMYRVSSLAELIALQADEDTVMAKVMAVLALVALILSVVGVYGVMAHSVATRTREMGIRMALGAQQRSVIKMVVRQGIGLALAGVTIGIVIALGVTKSLSFFLFGVNPFDPLTFAAVAGVLLASGLLATYVPARRATRVDPVTALRTE